MSADTAVEAAKRAHRGVVRLVWSDEDLEDEAMRAALAAALPLMAPDRAMREALDWYANPDTWAPVPPFDGLPLVSGTSCGAVELRSGNRYGLSPGVRDDGTRARIAMFGSPYRDDYRPLPPPPPGAA